jgi:sortase A
VKNRYRIKGKRRTIKAFALGIIILGVLFTSWNMVKFGKGYFAGWQERRGGQETTQDLTPSKEEASSGVSELKEKVRLSTSEDALYTVRPQTGDKVGELYIPKLDATLPIYEGTGEEELEQGVGHYADSVLPGERDNCVLSGHRDTVFRDLGEIGEGDSLIVNTSAGEFEYQVTKVRIVDKDDKTVIVPKPRATLTVSTCYPFVYIGAAPERYVLVAELVN